MKIEVITIIFVFLFFLFIFCELFTEKKHTHHISYMAKSETESLLGRCNLVCNEKIYNEEAAEYITKNLKEKHNYDGFLVVIISNESTKIERFFKPFWK